MAILTRWCSTIFRFWPEALYTTKMPMHDDDGQYAGQRTVEAQRAQGSATRGQGAAGSGRRKFVVNHVSALMHVAMKADQRRPEQRADERREPAAECGHRIAGGAVHPEQNELIAGQQQQKSSGIATEPRTRGCAGAGAWPTRPSSVSASACCPSTTPWTTSSARPDTKGQSEAAGARRLDAPIKHHEHQKVRAQRFQHGG